MNQKEKLDRISIINVKNKLKLNEICTIGKNIYVRCPFCSSKRADMKLSTDNNTFICKNCEEQGSSISLYAKYYKITNKEAYIRLLKKDADLNTKMINIANNNKKDVDELDYVYSEFLKLLSLSENHKNKLLSLGFTLDEIKNIGFKTIPSNENEKIIICIKLLEKGFSLDGIPGFFQNSKFQWTFSSHKGFFIPVINNIKIIGLRIHLDNEYSTDATDIWFSSNGKFNGTKMSNNIMVLRPNNIKIQDINKKKDAEDIIIATEMLLAYKLHIKFKNYAVIGVPNFISKNEIRKLYDVDDVNNILLVMEQHTIKHTCNSILNKLKSIYKEDKIKINFSVRSCEIPNSLQDILDGANEKFNVTKEFIRMSA